MSDFDYLYDRGLVDISGSPTWNEKPESINKLKTNEYFINLTPKKYLFDNGLKLASGSHERDKADLVENDYFTVEHDRYNIYDKYAIKVLSNNRCIGYIEKNTKKMNIITKNEINSLCFHNGLIKNISVIKRNYKYILLIHDNKKNFNTIFEKVEKILFRDRNIVPKQNEVDTIKYVLKNKENYDFTEEELFSLKLRKIQLIFNSFGKVLGSIVCMILYLTETIISTILTKISK